LVEYVPCSVDTYAGFIVNVGQRIFRLRERKTVVMLTIKKIRFLEKDLIRGIKKFSLKMNTFYMRQSGQYTFPRINSTFLCLKKTGGHSIAPKTISANAASASP